MTDPDADREGDVRVVDESGEDYLYPADWFVAVEVPKAVQVDRPSGSRDEAGDSPLYGRPTAPVSPRAA